jgi:hypothetical protein
VAASADRSAIAHCAKGCFVAAPAYEQPALSRCGRPPNDVDYSIDCVRPP